MIGRMGELVVYHWLKKRLPEQDIDKAWRSKNAVLTTGRPGDDELGYDFEITFRKQTLHIEVKASLGDPQQFEMGETEVRAARKAARPRSGSRYVIAYVRNLSDLAGARVELLPNPMTDEGSNVLEILGEGIRYGFRRG
jgi:Protein NO VEIN, C-terminal